MLERKYDPALPYRIALYGRMSDPRQNKRSPDQQFATIKETISRCGYPWVCITTRRDDGISGRYLRKRTGLQGLLRDIEAGLLQIDLIVVDTLERLGRAEEIAELRRKLCVEYGVLVVAADNHFADPTGVVGKAVGLVENIRSTEDGRIKAHNVVRGKKDAARLKRWPGGPPPFGFRLQPVVNDAVVPPDVYSVLEHEPRQAAALRLAFERAAATGEGDLRLSQWWNASPDIPDDFKPISPTTMGYRLENPIALGRLRWGKNRTGVINDTRVVEANPDGAELIADFCPPLVSVELYERVQALRRARSQQIKTSRQAKHADTGPTKLIAPQTRGLTLKYLLTGLVRCGSCNASMRPLPSGRQSKGGKRYVYYVCPRYQDGACANGRYVPEDSLRDAVLARLRARLFPPPEQPDQVPTWLPELMTMVRLEQQRSQDDEPDRAAAERDEVCRLEQQLAGWSLSLGNPQLSAAVRVDIEARYAEAKQRQQELVQTAAARHARQEYRDRALNPAAVVAELQRLGDVLAAFNPTVGNLELSKHLDVITCFSDGRVELRGTFVGLFAGAVELLSRDDNVSGSSEAAARDSRFAPVTPRRRGRLQIPTLSASGKEGLSDSDTALDPERFAGLPESYFWKELFVLVEKPSWAEANAAEVARLRTTGLTMAALAQHFGKTVPTIRKALRHAQKKDSSLSALPGKMPRRRWEEDYATEVARLYTEGNTWKALSAHFGKSEPTLRKALRFAAAAGNAKPEAPEADNGEDRA